MAAAVQRIAIETERHRFTFRQTRRTVPITFSMMLVQASERRSSFGSRSRVTVMPRTRPWEGRWWAFFLRHPRIERVMQEQVR